MAPPRRIRTAGGTSGWATDTVGIILAARGGSSSHRRLGTGGVVGSGGLALVVDRDFHAVPEIGEPVEHLTRRPLPDEDRHPLRRDGVLRTGRGEPEDRLP